MAEMSIRLLGRPHIECGGLPVVLERRKTLGLLAYVALHPKPCDRQALAALLWPDAGIGDAPAYLRNALWLIKKTPLSPWLDVEGPEIALRSNRPFFLDVLAFRERVREAGAVPDRPGSCDWPGAGRLAEAIDLYRGDFMAGFTLKSNVDFEDWQLRLEESLRRIMTESLAKLVAYHAARHEVMEAMSYTRRWLEIDPLDEQAQARMMVLQARLGKRTDALRFFVRCERRLRDELDVPPSGRMLRLRDRIRSGEVGEAPAPSRESQPRRALAPSQAPFIGREKEVEEISRMLGSGTCRILALIGPGGIGKTRLAQRVGQTRSAGFADGAVFVPLAPVAQGDQVLPAVLAALGSTGAAQLKGSQRNAAPEQRSEQDRLIDFLREKQLLLILDNVEHVLDGLGWLNVLEEAAPRVRILLTSRVRPSIAGAWIMEVGGLACPQAGADAAAEPACDSVKLFLEYARRAGAHFHPDDEEQIAIGDICRMLDGLPLGIELAAAWTRSLSCRDLAAEIRRDIDFLNDSPATVPERHHGLRAVFEQSWARLSDDERTDFRRLALFRGGFTLHAAEAVARTQPRALARLLDASLVRRAASGRYEMLEIVRQFAEERLRSLPQEFNELRNHHALHFLEDLASQRDDLQGERVAAALAAIWDDADNLREAWTVALHPPKPEWIVPALIPCFLMHDIPSRWPDGARRFHEAAEALADASDPDHSLALGFALVAEGWFQRQSDWVHAFERMKAGEAILERLAPVLESTFGRTLVTVETRFVDRARAEACARRTAAEQECLSDRWGLALNLDILALVSTDPAEQERCALSSLALREEIGDRWGTALSQHVAGGVAQERGDLDLARKRYEQSLAVRRELDTDAFGTASCLLDLGWVAFDQGDSREAERCFSECLEIGRIHGNSYLLLRSHCGLGTAAFQAERLGDAHDHYVKTFSLSSQFAGKYSPGETAGLLALIDFLRERPEDGRARLAEARAIDSADPWVRLAGARAAFVEGDRASGFRILGDTLAHIARDGGDGHFIIECLMETAERLSSTASAHETFAACGYLLRKMALSPAKRTRISRLLRHAARNVPRARRPGALAEGRDLTLPALVVRILSAAPFSASTMPARISPPNA